MGVFLFWLQYVIAGVILYHILRCIYIKADVDTRSYDNKYKRTDHDERLKYPLWLILVALMVFSIPFANIFLFSAYLGYRVMCDRGEEHNPYYCKSVFTKKY